MPIEIYWAKTSPYSDRVLLAMAIKQIPYVSKCLSFRGSDLTSREFLDINPRAQVPALCDGNFKLYESIAILNYLEKIHTEPHLFSDNAEQLGLQWRLIMECVYYLEPHMSDFAGTILSSEIAANESVTVDSRIQIERELVKLNALLKLNPYLTGTYISAADVVIYPVVALLIRAAQHLDNNKICGSLLAMDHHYPAIKKWIHLIDQTPGFNHIDRW